MNKKLLVILGNQLFNPDYLNNIQFDWVFMAEDYELCTYYKHHKQKILMFLLAMREYRDELEKLNYKVIYEGTNLASFKRKYEQKLQDAIKETATTELIFYEIEDKFFEQRILEFATKKSFSLRFLPSPMFLSTRSDYKTFSKDKTFLLMGSYYKMQRKKFNLLLQDGKPVGGKWSFDELNRKKLPKNVKVPELPKPDKSKYERELKTFIKTEFKDHPGDVENRWTPVTREGSKKWLKLFLKEKLVNFGDYEDAISNNNNFIFHSAISPLLNIGLLTPREVIDELEGLEATIPLNSLEGFLRQIIGWREFIRGVYQERGVEQQRGNFFKNYRFLKDSWYTGNTGIAPLDDAIKFSIKYGYTHHINRLMVIGNTMNLSGINPKEIYKWFMEMYVDSSDWVMTPNVFGMATFADGGLMATKPYVCGSNYILKMSDYKKGDWCDVIDGLYWKFIENNQDFFKGNPRLSIMIRALKNLKAERKTIIYAAAEHFLEKNTYLIP
tara:strand:- start:49371 stop:50864 length:1494 start_codon:yes stop_codon:yes gene_type:complete